MKQIATHDPLTGRALTVEDLFAKADEERFFREMQEKAHHDYINAMNTAKKRGLEEGMERGLEKGKFEARRKIARSMLANGMAPDLIAKFTDLPVEEIKALYGPK
jgi:predicted transposase/invertase (TIGR01784 family)